MTKKKKTDEDIQKELGDMVENLCQKLGMSDWKIEVNYCPDEDCGTIADVSYSIHKEADINIYRYRPKYVKDDLLHELMHCKLSRARRGLDLIIAYQRDLIEKLAQDYEEMVADDLARFAGMYTEEKKNK